MKAEDLMAKARRLRYRQECCWIPVMRTERAIEPITAMFDAARAALLASGAPVEPEIARTHSGLISAFSLHLVKTGRVPVALGKALNKVEDLRLVADYKGDPIGDEEAGWAVKQAEAFVHAMQTTFIPESR